MRRFDITGLLAGTMGSIARTDCRRAHFAMMAPT